jgi:hypothetical protein
MTTKLITTAVGDSKESALEAKIIIISSAFLMFCGLIALATYNLAHYPELWNAITLPTT